MKANLWKGMRLTDDEFKSEIIKHLTHVETWNQSPLNHHALYTALTFLREELLEKKEIYHLLLNDLKKRQDINDEECILSMEGLIEFINTDQLRTKLVRELGSEYPFELKRPNGKVDYFESWYPMGTIVHVTPNNSPLLSVLGIIEGLLSGNVNILKLARKDSEFASLFYERLFKLDRTHTLKNYVYIGKISSKDKEMIKAMFSVADVISAWGGEESIQSVKELAPRGVRIVDWGHKISFAYLSKKASLTRESYKKLAIEICLNEQQACSSPQCVYVEDASFIELRNSAELLSQALKEYSPTVKKIEPGLAENAELTVTKEQVRLRAVLGETILIEDSNNDWRILVDKNEGLQSSPLFRTIWLKPLRRNKMIEVLSPLKMYLQTAGILCEKNEVQKLTQDLFKAGVTRIRSCGEMTDSYIGEPHDGVYALERYCKRINFHDTKDSGKLSHNVLMANKMSFEVSQDNSVEPVGPIMEKADFQKQNIASEYSDLFFYSGGSSGEPKLSIFTYDDYHRQMELAAEGLFAAGLEPKTDRCMNLFYAGSLYGGFTSFFTILEKLRAVQFPMGASTDFKMVGETIVKNNVDTLLGMPSYLIQLFRENSDLFRKYRGIKKIFFGGEHFSETQRNFLHKEFSVQFIRSASYGSVDAGPLGYQCTHAKGAVHHLHERLHHLEIVELENDKRVQVGEIGRLLFTSKVRHGQEINRYSIGDVGKIIEGTCECGRNGIRFELLGRHGDVFRIGTIFLSYQRFQKILIDHFEFEGSFQIHLYPGSEEKKEKVELFLETFDHSQKPLSWSEFFIKTYHDLEEAVLGDKVLEFNVSELKRENLIFNPTTKKLRTVIDHRIK
jgi:phenylacetate-coenzyme A ligase PaaK-like adenylate-forming protein